MQYRQLVWHISLLAVFLTPFLGAAPKTTISMGFNPAENVDTTETNGKLFGEYFKKKTGVSVKTFVATDYTALIEALRSGRIDFAWLAPFSFVKAEEMANAVVLLKSVRKGHAVYYSAIITRSDKPFSKVEDLKGKNMAWVDPASVAGHIFPKASLKTEKKIDADTFFARQVFAGSHDALVLSVLNGTVDAGATFCNYPDGRDGAWVQFLKTPEEQKRIKVLYVSPPIPGDTLSTSKKFLAENGELVEKMKKLLIEMGNDAEGKKILTALYRIDAMVPATSKDYDPVRAAAKAINVER